MQSDLGPSLNSSNTLRQDLSAGLVVFLVALPLCLGIALASGAPLFSGIIAGVVGGVIISVLSGSQLSVSGPAAGLTTIVAAAILTMQTFPAFLAVVVLAGAMQLGLGIMKAGMIGNYVPNSVIKGMLAAIGIVIILKQIPHALGRDADFEGDLSFLEKGSNNTITDIVNAVLSASPGAVAISLTCLLALIVWEHMANRGHKLFQTVPGALVVVLLGIGMNELFRYVLPAFCLVESEHLVTLPMATNSAEFFRQFTMPDFTALMRQDAWRLAATIAVVASLETLLSLEAADKLDPMKRISPASRELRAQGVGNMVSGLLGGLPVTSVVVRSSANVYAGARTWVSSFFHGLLLMISVFLFPQFLNKTPLACLAALLIMVGFKLTKPKLYGQMKQAGIDQFLPFIVTVIAIVFSDLLTGVVIGMIVGLFFVIRSNHHSAITLVTEGNYYLMRFNKDATFVNKTEFKRKLRTIPDGALLIVDGTKAAYIDYDIFEVMEDFKKSAEFRKIQIELKHFTSRLVGRGR